MIAPFAPEPARSDHPNNETDYNNDPFQCVTSYKKVNIPLIVSKLVSMKPSCFERNSRSLSAASTSVSFTSLSISSSSQTQNSARAAASLHIKYHNEHVL